MRASTECGLPHISSLDAHNISRIHLLQRRCTLLYIFCAAAGTSGHRVHLTPSVVAMSALLAALIGAICSSTSATVCIEYRRPACSYTRVGRGRDHDHHRLPSCLYAPITGKVLEFTTTEGRVISLLPMISSGIPCREHSLRVRDDAIRSLV